MNFAVGIIRSNQDLLAMLVYGGVFERHPRLRVVCVEADASWAPHWMHRMDHTTSATATCARSSWRGSPASISASTST